MAYAPGLTVMMGGKERRNIRLGIVAVNLY